MGSVSHTEAWGSCEKRVGPNVRVPEEESRGWGMVFKKMMENRPKLFKDANPQVQESHKPFISIS